MPPHLKTITSFSLLLSLCACANIRNYTMPDENNLLSGAGSMLVDEKGKAAGFEQMDLKHLLEDYGFSEVVKGKWQLENDPKYQYQRNELQDHIIAASNQRCSAYLRTLVASKETSTMGWGGFATLLSGAASVVSPASVAKALAAGSTVSSGILNLYNEAYFNSLAINAISAGITRQRQAILEDLTNKRSMASLTEYPVNRAVSDALSYHASCNIISGLETAVSATQAASFNTIMHITEPPSNHSNLEAPNAPTMNKTEKTEKARKASGEK